MFVTCLSSEFIQEHYTIICHFWMTIHFWSPFTCIIRKEKSEHHAFSESFLVYGIRFLESENCSLVISTNVTDFFPASSESELYIEISTTAVSPEPCFPLCVSSFRQFNQRF